MSNLFGDFFNDSWLQDPPVDNTQPGIFDAQQSTTRSTHTLPPQDNHQTHTSNFSTISLDQHVVSDGTPLIPSNPSASAALIRSASSNSLHQAYRQRRRSHQPYLINHSGHSTQSIPSHLSGFPDHPLPSQPLNPYLGLSTVEPVPRLEYDPNDRQTNNIQRTGAELITRQSAISIASKDINETYNSFLIPEITQNPKRRRVESQETHDSKAMKVVQMWHSQYRRFPGRDDLTSLAQLTGRSVSDVQEIFNRMMIPDSTYQTEFPTLRDPASELSFDAPQRVVTHDGFETSAILHEPDRHQSERGFSPNIKACIRLQDESNLPMDPSKPFQCTRKCGSSLPKEGDWKKHEEKSTPQRVWICMRELTTNEGRCIYCNASNTTVGHLLEHHRNEPDGRCWKEFYRKDHYIEHLKHRHKIDNKEKRDSYSKISCKDMSMMLGNSDRWCGFCQNEIHNASWKERCQHICRHFRDGDNISQWRDFEERTQRLPKKPHRRGDQNESDHYRDDSDEDGDDGYGGGSGPLGRSYGKGGGRSGRSTRGTDSNQQATPGPSGSRMHSTTIGEASPMDTTHLDCQGQREEPGLIADGPSITHSKGGLQEENSTSRGPHSSFMKIKSLGRGAFSIVDEVVHLTTRLRLARKSVIKPTQSSRRASSLAASSRQIAAEIEILRSLRHPHIIRLLGSYTMGQQSFLLLSPAADTNLAEYMMQQAVDHDSKGTTLMRFAQWYGCLASALHYLHGNSVIHGDIKPANILVKGPQILLTDFGSSRSVQQTYSGSTASGPITPQYAAPEVLDSRISRPSSDIWSLGCVFVEIVSFCCASRPEFQRFQEEHFSPDKAYCRNIEPIRSWLRIVNRGQRVRRSVFNENILLMLNLNPDERPNSQEVLQRFPPSQCCVAWPSSFAERNGPFQELYALSSLVLDRTDICRTNGMALMNSETALKVGKERNASSPSLRDRTAEEFLRLWSQRYGNKIRSSLELATYWLHTCLKGHAVCNCIHDRTSFQWSPTRLIDVEFYSENDSQVRLVVCQDSKQQYLALSYVWGNTHPQERLTTTRLEGMKQSIPVAGLQSTIKRAIEITRSLGVQYLWIDSLCIMQDDNEDRKKEVGRMGQVYRNSLCTIFVDEQPSTNDKQMEKRGGDVRAPASEFSQTMWYTRGWTLQEATLSPRKLFFGKSQVFFQCFELDASEALPNGLPGFLWSAVHEITAESDRWLEGHENDPKWRAQEYSHWHDVVNAAYRIDQYGDIGAETSNSLLGSRGQSTARDAKRIHILSGISEYLRPSLGDRCFAGLWQQTLPWSLLWIVGGPSCRHDSLIWIGSTYAPSWSWSSISGQVTLPDLGTGQDLVEVLGVGEVITKLPKSGGVVLVCCLKLRGKLSMVRMDTRAAHKSIQQVVVIDGLEGPVVASVYLDTTPHVPEASYQCLWLRASTDMATKKPTEKLSGLLIKAQDVEGNIYTREGLISIPDGRESAALLGTLMNGYTECPPIYTFGMISLV